MERRDVPGIQPAHGWAESQGRQAPVEVQGAKSLPRIQPADGWPGSQGQESPRARCRDAKSWPHANEVCISAPFGLPVHTVDSGMGIRKIEVLLTLHLLDRKSTRLNSSH